MILRRIADALKRQDWAQVTIELLIVIVGIFLGLQVQGWYEDRGDREQEQVYLQRLHSDILGLAGYQEALAQRRFIDRLRETFRTNLGEVIDFLGGHNPDITLENRHCVAIIFSHTINNSPNNSIATLNELISSGQISLIQNEQIKIALSEYVTATQFMENQLEHLNSVALVLARKYPHIIAWNISSGAENFREQRDHSCNFDKMIGNTAFINDLADNFAKQETLGISLGLLSEKIDNIHEVLDKELALTHEEPLT